MIKEFDLKHELYDKVYYLEDNKIKEGIVLEIEIKLFSEDIWDDWPEFIQNQKVFYIVQENEHVSYGKKMDLKKPFVKREKFYKTQEDLFDSIKIK